MPQGKFFRYGYAVLLILLIIYFLSNVSFILNPIFTAMNTLFLPFMLAGIFYYLLRPAVHLLSKWNWNKSLSISAIFLVLLGLVTFSVVTILPMIQSQLQLLIDNLPQIVLLAKDQVNQMLSNKWVSSYLEQNQMDYSAKISDYANSVISNTGNAFNAVLGFISHIVILLSTVPFILFYLLKDGEKVPAFIIRLMPSKFHEEGQKILGEMDGALSSYIQGKILVSLCLGLFIYIGYSIIGLEYSLVLALSAALMNVIPFIGLFIGIIPSIIVAFIHSPGMLLKVLIVIIVVQQIESNFLSPQVMGKKLDIHPLTIILLLIVVGKFAGLLGMFIAIPTYAIVKVIVTHLLRFNGLRKR